MVIEKTEVYGFKAALRGCRNPLDSWEKSDSIQILTNFADISMKSAGFIEKNYNLECVQLGEKDKKLSQSLVKAGGSHSKHLRLIQVWVDMTLPRYIHQELDTYKHIEKVSCSTIHKLMSYNLTPEMFEGGYDYMSQEYIDTLQSLIDSYKNCTDNTLKSQYKLTAKRLLPESFLQKRTFTTNYQQLLNIYEQRNNNLTFRES